MKRIQTIGLTFFLAVFLLILLAPATVFAAAECSTVGGGNCEAAVTADCECGGVAAKAGDYCKASKSAVYATKADCNSGTGEIPPANFRLGTESEVPQSGGAILARIQIIANWVFAVFLAISLIYIVLAAFQFVTGGGDPAQVSGARQKLIYALIGIAIALMAAGFPAILRSIVT
ncbi:hypothetical protein IH982_02375 [Patescibacteria group bacterium]|nr:hypothetical protein [Patescibacteria group bacterium]